MDWFHRIDGLAPQKQMDWLHRNRWTGSTETDGLAPQKQMDWLHRDRWTGSTEIDGLARMTDRHGFSAHYI